MKPLLALLAWLLVTPSLAQEPSLESIAMRYITAETYCEKGKLSRRFDKSSPLQEVPYERCSHRDGRFRIVEENIVSWSDGKQKHHRFFFYNKFYQQSSLDEDDGITYGLYRNRSQIVPVVRLRHYVIDARELTEAGRRAKYLQSFKPAAALSGEQHLVFERTDPYYKTQVERVWVRNSDKAIVKYELLSGDMVMRKAEVSRAEFDRPLGPAELSFSPPLYARLSPQSNPQGFIALLAIAVLLAGFGVWGRAFSRAEDPDDVVHYRGRAWRFLLWAFLGTVALLAALTAATWGGSGHPPAIAYVMVLAVFAAIGFGLAALFVLASYPMQWWLGKRPPA